MLNYIATPVVAEIMEHDEKILRRKRKKQYKKERRQKEVDNVLRKLELNLDRIPDYFYWIPLFETIIGFSVEAVNLKQDCLLGGNLKHLHSIWTEEVSEESDGGQTLSNTRDTGQRVPSIPIKPKEKTPQIKQLLLTTKDKTIQQNEGFRSHTETVESCSRKLTKSLWDKIPKCCTPHTDLTADKRIVGINKNNENKYYKKLLAKLKCGDITSEEMQMLLLKNGKILDTFDETNPMNTMLGIGKEEAQKIQLENGNTFPDELPLMSGDRAFKKCLQIENFASIFEIFGHKKCVIDFGSGSGNLCLAFAAIFPETKFVFCDMKDESLKILENRATKAKLKNVFTFQYIFSPLNLDNDVDFVKKQYPDFDLGIGLHCCGNFTDLILGICTKCNADCVVCPCCNGKIARFIEKEEYDVGDRSRKEALNPASQGVDVSKNESEPLQVSYPRSEMFRSKIDKNEYCVLSKAADDEFNYLAKCCIELDRAMWALEQGFEVTLLRMNPLISSPKHHVIYVQTKS